MFSFDSYSLTAEGGPDDRKWSIEFARNDVVFAGIEVTFDDSLKVVDHRLWNEDGMTASEVTRFPWVKWIDAARAAVLTRRWDYGPDGAIPWDAVEDVDAALEPLYSELTRVRGLLDAAVESKGRSRPGPKPPVDYAEVLARYNLLKQNPDTRRRVIVELQREYERQGVIASKGTIETWLKRAKELAQAGNPEGDER